ncbi:MAG TPA: hypothetical protein VMT24_07080 [Aggregatilineaceae bacterium]|jgi:hypothetical protein|nr:hypothetical protein [Aggregatilineaceae bacterium]
MRSLKEVQAMMQAVGIPGRDAYDLPTSTKTFPDGGHYRMEISGVERPQVLEAVIDEMNRRKIAIHRLISVVMGSSLLDDAELRDFAQMAADARLEVIITPGPRSGWDIGRQLVTPEGGLSGLRYRGSDQLSYVIAEILRCVDLGFRGFLAIDEGLLWLLNALKQRGDIPQDVVFKVSIFAGHASAAGGRVLQSLGAGTFNPLGDLSLPQLASIRQAVDLPLDLHIMLSDSFGGFNRFYEGAEMARVCSPCYYKIEPGGALVAGPGAIYKPWVGAEFHAQFAREKVKYAQIIHELIQATNPALKLSPVGSPDLAIPKP